MMSSVSRLRSFLYASNFSRTQIIGLPMNRCPVKRTAKYGGFNNRSKSRTSTYFSPRLFHTLQKSVNDIDVNRLITRNLTKISQSSCKHGSLILSSSQSGTPVPLTRFCSASPRISATRSRPTWQRLCVEMSAFPVLPFNDKYGEKHYTRASGHKDVNLSGVTVRNFATSFQAHGRHRTYSVASSRSGFLDSQSLNKRNEEEVNNRQALGKVSSIPEKVKSDVNHRMSNIKIHLLDQNKNIKEKISIHRSKGVKAVRKLRRKLETEKEDIRTIPNLLTTLRMASAPVLGYLVVNDYFGCALSIFVLAGFTDLLDGYIARNFKNQRTALGTALDPLADKLLMCCLTLSLTSAGLIPVPLTVLILSRDAGLILASFVIRYKSLSPPRTLSRYFDVTHVTAKLFPSTISKVNTGLQLSYVACVLASPVFGFIDHPLLQVLMYTTAATTFLSGLDYIITWRRRLKIVKNK